MVTSTCPDGLTCVAGSCSQSSVSSASLPDYTAAQIFGGGTGNGDGACFDTATCFGAATEVTLDLATFASDPTTCRASLSSASVNVALRTQGSGICGPSGCFVALDAGSDAGWKAGSGGTITLPPAVCTQVQKGDLPGVVAAPVGTGTCQQKTSSIPTCGPWSATGPPSPAPGSTAVVVAPGQANPASLAVADGYLYWVCRGTLDAQGQSQGDGAAKGVLVTGGQPTVFAEPQPPPPQPSPGPPQPGALVIDPQSLIVLWTDMGRGEMVSAPFLSLDAPPVAVSLIGALLQPAGVAIQGGTVYWTQAVTQSPNVFEISTMVDTTTNALSTNGAQVPIAAPPESMGTYPSAIAAAGPAVCWTYEDKLTATDGVVACSVNGAQSTVIAAMQPTPRSLTLSADGATVYWANFASMKNGGGGGIFQASTSAPVSVSQVAAEDFPGGLAIDGQTLYWTSRTQGTVMRQGSPTPMVTAQANPGAIAVDNGTLYWVNEGSGGAARDGAIMKIAITKP